MTILVRGRFNVNNHAHLITGRKNLTEWFYWYFANRDVTPYLTRQGAGRFKLTKAALLKSPCALPRPSEQREIANVLSDTDALLVSLDGLIAKKRDLKKAAMQQLLTGQTRLPGFHGDWAQKPVGHAGRCLRGVSYRGESDLSTHDTAYTTRLLRSNNVQNAFVNTDGVQFVHASCVSQHQILRANDILICMANGRKALVGKAGIFAISDGFDYTF